MGSQTHGLTGVLWRDSFHLEQNLARTHHRYPVIGCSLAFTHTGFSRFLGHWLIWKQTDLNLAASLDKASHRHTCRLNLTVGNPARLENLQSVIAESQLTPAPRLPGHAPALLLAVFHFLWHQHRISS